MKRLFSFEKTLGQAQERAKAKAAGEDVPPLPVWSGEKRQPTIPFDFDVALRRAKEKSGGVDKPLDETVESL